MSDIRTVLAAAAIGAWAANASAAAPVAAFLGSWTIAGSAPAPGIAPNAAQDPAEVRRLTGAHLRFSAGAIAGPRPLACRRPRYELKEYSPDMLFQGTLTDPAAQAKALGFTGTKVRTLETGCDGALDFHFVGSGTALFMLNNRIYTIEHDVR